MYALQRTPEVAAWLLVSAVLWAGVLIPHVLPAAAHPDWSYVVPADYVQDDYLYFSRANRAAREGRDSGNTYLFEHASDPVYHRYLDSVAITPLLKAFLPDFYTGFAVIGLLLTLLMVGAMVLLFKSMVPDPALAWLGALCMLLLGLEENLSRVICHRIDAYAPLALGMLALRQIHLGKARGLAWGAAAGLCGMLALYSYPFYGIYFEGFAILLFLYALARGDRARAGAYGLGLALSAVLAIPYILHQYGLAMRPDFAEIQARIGFLRSHFPSLGGSAVLVVSAALLPLLPRTERPFFGAAFLAGLVCLNQHVITGNYIVQNTDHLELAYRLPIWMAVTAAAGALLQRPGRLARAGLALVIGGFLVTQVVKAHRPERLENLRKFSAYRGALQWLDANAAPGSVVVSAETFSSFLAGMTPYYPYMSYYAYVSTTPGAELRQRALSQMKLFGVRSEDLPAFIERHYLLFWGTGYPSVISRAHILNRLYGLAGMGKAYDVDAYKAARLAELTEQYQAFKPAAPFAGLRADYVVYGPWEKETYPNFSGGKKLISVYEDADVSLYERAE